MTISSIGRRVALVGSLAMLVALLPLAASAQDPTGPVIIDLEINDELEASDSVQTSVLWAQQAFPDGSTADEVLIATDQDFADALASGVLQGDSPLYYTDGESLDQLVVDEIARLGATSATILGGEVAVAASVEDDLADAGITEVNRLWGESRIETAVAIAEQELEGDTVFLARAFADTDPTQAFADALALGGWAAASGTPVLLTQTDVLTGNTRAFLEGNTDITNVTVIGGDAAISEDVVGELEELGLTVERIGAETRWGTAVAIAEARELAAADVDQVVFVEGQAEDAYINGFAAAAYSAANDAPILLVNGNDVPQETQDYLGDEATFDITDADGETAAVLGTNVSDEAAQTLADALSATLVTVQLAGPIEGNESIDVLPKDEVTVEAGEERQYTATGLDADTTYEIVLFDAANVSVDENGVVTFEGTGGNADAGTIDSDITVVNGSPVGGTPDADASSAPVNGTITFTVTTEGFESFVPVVFDDANDDGFLNIDSDGLPVEDEAFGVGGVTNVLPAEAAQDAPGANATIEGVDKDENWIVADAGAGPELYYYDSNDSFFHTSAAPASQLTVEQFEAILSVGDELDATTSYQPEESLSSQFVLLNIVPQIPTISGDAPSDTSVTLTLDETTIDSGATVNIYGAEDPNNADPLVPAFADTTLLVTSTEDGDPVTPDYQVTVTGLDPSTDYTFFATQTVDGEESGESTARDVTTTPPTPPNLTVAYANDINDSIGSTNQVVFVFDEPVVINDVAGFTVNPTGQPFTLHATAATLSEDGTQVTVTLDGTLNDAPLPDVPYDANVADAAVSDEDGNDFVGPVTYVFLY